MNLAKMKRSIILLVGVLLTCLSPDLAVGQISYSIGTTPMASAEIAAFHQKFDQKMSELKTLDASFTQIKQFDFSDKKIRSNGRLYYKSPQLIRWEYVSPRNSVLLINGEKTISSTGKTGNLKALDGLIAGLTQGSKMFDPKNSLVEYYKGQRKYVVVMSPKDKKAQRFINKIEIQIDQGDLLVERLRIVQANRDFLDLEFGAVRTNISLQEKLFDLP